jgi:hypothetical protein
MTPTAICARLSANVCELRRSLDLEGINILGYLPNLGINAIGTGMLHPHIPVTRPDCQRAQLYLGC